MQWKAGWRGRVGLFALAGCVACCGLSSSRSQGRIAPVPELSRAGEKPVQAGGCVVSVENGGLLFTDNAAGVSGLDAGYSLPLGKRTLWLFGDVFLLPATDPARSYLGGISNCALLVGAGQGRDALRHYAFLTDPKTGLARQTLPYAGAEGVETRLWPLGGWHDAARQTAYLFYEQVRSTGKGPLDFQVMGHGLASAETAKPEAIQFRRLPLDQPDTAPWWPGNGPLFGSAVVAPAQKNDPDLYIVGTREQGGGKVGLLARVPKEHIAERSAYRYFAGSADSPQWSETPADAVAIEGLKDFPNELSIAWNRYLGGYLAVQSVKLETRLRLSLAPHPWGPYRTIAEIGAPHRALEQAFCYAGKEHPELAEAGGRILYLTYMDSQRYWLQLLKVTLAHSRGH